MRPKHLLIVPDWLLILEWMPVIVVEFHALTTEALTLITPLYSAPADAPVVKTA